MTQRKVEANMQALGDKLSRLRQKRESLIESPSFTDSLRAQTLDSRIGEVEDELADLERKHPTAAQNVSN